MGGSSSNALEPAEACAVRRELQELRDKVIGLLDRLDTGGASLAAGSQGGIGDAVVGQGKTKVSDLKHLSIRL